MIVRIELKGKEDFFIMMFGDSYKKWYIQFEEYCHKFPELRLINIDVSKEDWIGWGGLKWCNENEFQEELNREGCQDKEPDNPKPRQYNKMHFESNKFIESKVKKIINIAFVRNEFIKKRNEEWK
jgi:hypothetical protein